MTAEEIAAGRDGPRINIKATCSSCRHVISERYRVQGDSGHDVYCQHPSLPERKRVGDTRWDTPNWCPAVNMPGLKAAEALYNSLIVDAPITPIEGTPHDQ
ncbi:hypothetical protein Saro_2979 [Novosphingobium aromaticivorans DSM 12444]|uniref:Uncharacterized protein n=1 Tax=Novosphingobium aromaticivorans (strain ATCC 700278 / DSM 12444 / CCUG 56034 / CIP 105152 / NBRC 16084 / F199) TaxID=279238 RepID=Q2G409_NOVAD|nr:hypothetical protein Saro_2979 [Novosphingobium aromaticivorans DSM 12444]